MTEILGSGKAQQALHSWLDRSKSVVEEGQRMGEIRSAVRAAELAILIVTTLEGSLMVSRLQRKDDSLSLACRHLDEYLEATVRARKSRSGAEKS
jgi:TetR/AcrR family transcriptional repressor of nem operon